MDWMLEAIAFAIALLLGYVFAATRNWVWYPNWLKRFVFDEKKQ